METRMRDYYELHGFQRPRGRMCPHGNGIWYDEKPTYSWDGEPKHYRDKYRYPYSYDAFFIFGDRKSIEESSADYTDRYHLWDVEKYKAAYAAIGRQCRWDQMSQVDVDKFVKAYYGPDCEATGLVEWCHASSCYPCWSVHFRRASLPEEPR